MVRVTENPELDDVVDPRPLTDRERVCTTCWLAYNRYLDQCPSCGALR